MSILLEGVFEEMDRAKLVRLSERLEKLLHTGIGLAGGLFDDVVRNEPNHPGEIARERSERLREIGVVAGMTNVRTTDEEFREGNYGDAGPMIRVRLLRDRSCWPEVSVGAYAKWGTDQLDSSNVYLAAAKTFPIDESGFLKTVTFQGGFRESWLEAPDRNTNRFYGGLEVQLPHDFYLVGEVTQFARRKDDFTPWAGGIQWRVKRFGVTAAIVQSGDDRPWSIYLGIGSGLGVEPVRIPTRPVRP